MLFNGVSIIASRVVKWHQPSCMIIMMVSGWPGGIFTAWQRHAIFSTHTKSVGVAYSFEHKFNMYYMLDWLIYLT